MRFCVVKQMNKQQLEILTNNSYYIIAIVLSILISQYPDQFNNYTVEIQDITYIFQIAMSVDYDTRNKGIGKFKMTSFCMTHYFSKTFLLNFIFFGRLITLERLIQKLSLGVIGLSIFLAKKEFCLRTYEESQFTKCFICFGDMYGGAQTINKIMNNTLFKYDEHDLFTQILFIFLVLITAAFAPSHKYLESFYGLGHKQKYQQKIKNSMYLYSIVIVILIICEYSYQSYIKQFVVVMFRGDHPFTEHKKMINHFCNVLFLIWAAQDLSQCDKEVQKQKELQKKAQ